MTTSQSSNFGNDSFAIYSKDPGEPTKALKQIISDRVELASLAIQRYGTKLALQVSRQQLEAYANSLEEKVQERAKEVKATVQQPLETNKV